MPHFDKVAFRKEIREKIAARKAATAKFVSGIPKYEDFIAKGNSAKWHKAEAYRSGILEKKEKKPSGVMERVMASAPTTAALSRRRVVNVPGGKLSYNPLARESVWLHPLRATVGVFRWGRNRSTRKAEVSELAKSREAKAAVETGLGNTLENRVSALQARYEQRLKRQTRRLESTYANLERLYTLLGRGKISPEKFELYARRFVTLRLRVERNIEESTKNYEAKLFEIVRSFSKERGDRRL